MTAMRAIDFGVYGVPESYLIDKQGIIRFKQAGPLDARNYPGANSASRDGVQQMKGVHFSWYFCSCSLDGLCCAP